MTADIVSAKNISRGLGFKSGVWLTATYGLNDSLFIKRAKGPLNRLNRIESDVWDRVNWPETGK